MNKTELPADLKGLLPLTPAFFFVLFSLAGGEKHGYAVMQDMAPLSGGKFRMGPGTLYATLQRLLEIGLIREVRGIATATERESRRRTYRITGSGKALLEGELDRMDVVLQLARRKKMAFRAAE